MTSLTRSRGAAIVGAQRPRVAKVPTYVSSAGEEAVELAAEAGLVLDPWQEYVLQESLGERGDGRWAAMEVGLLVPRQNGKGAITEARELAGLFLFGEERVVHTAHELKASLEAFERVLGLVEGRDAFRSKVERVRMTHGEEAIELKTRASYSFASAPTRRGRKQRLRFMARSKSAGRGLTGDVVVLDEAYALQNAMLASLFPILSTLPNPQVWYTSTIGDETAIVLSALRRRGHAGGKRLAFFEWSATEDADLDDPRAVRQANPGLGIRITAEYVEKEREVLTDADFARERLGIRRRGATKRVIPDEIWDAVQDREAAPAGALCFGVDVLPDRSSGAIVASGDGVAELVDQRVGVSWMVDRVVQLCKAHDGIVVVDKGGAAVSIADEIEAEDVGVQRLSSAEVADACGRFYDAIVDGAVKVRPHEMLSTAVVGAVTKPVGDRFVWSRTKSTTDVTPLMAASLAAAGVREGEHFAIVV